MWSAGSRSDAPVDAPREAVTTINVAAHYNAQQIAPLEQCFRRYEQLNPGVRVRYQQISYQDFFQTILISRAGRAPIDIYNLYSIWAPQLIATGALDRPPQDIERFVQAAYNRPTIDATTFEQQLYGIPAAVSVYQLIYNKKLLASAGFDAPPKTWPELVTVAQAVTKTNRQGNILVGGYAFGPTASNVTHVFYSQMYAAGVAPYSPDLRHTNLRSPTAVAILTEQADLFRRGVTSNSIAVLDFAADAVGMGVIANWQKDTLVSAFGDRFSQTVGVAPIPSDGPGGTMIYSFFWGVDSQSRVKRQAWDLLRWLNTPDGSNMSCTGTLLAGMGDLSGNRVDLAAMSKGADPFTQQYIDALQSPGATSQPNLWHAEEVDRLLKYYIELAWAGRMTPAAALAMADKNIRAILDEQP